MMGLFNEDIIPYTGTKSFLLGANLEDVRKLLKENHIPFNQNIEPNKGCTPEVPWTYIEIGKSITLCFAMDILFEIVFENEYQGKLPNGGYVGMKMSELLLKDKDLEYNDDEEDYISPNGYWIEDDIKNDEVVSITIYIPEADDDDEFFKYEWVNKYSEQ